MTLQQLRYVIEIARCGTVNTAAENLFISQPSLSKAVQNLEKELGISLFLRTPKGTVLTNDGAEFLAYDKRIVQEADSMQLHYATGKKTLSLRVSAYRLTLLDYAFLEYSRRTSLSSHAFSIELQNTCPMEAVQNLINRKTDLALLQISSINDEFWRGFLKSRDIEYHMLCSSSGYLLMRQGHPLSQKEVIRPEDWSIFPAVCATATESQEWLNYNREVQWVFSQPATQLIYAEDRASIYNIVMHTDAVFPATFALGVEQLFPGIVARPIHMSEEFWNIFWIKHKDVPLTAAMKDFIAVLEDLCQ